MSNFDGFPKKTPTFLRGISKNNNKEKHPAALHSAKLVNYSFDRWKKLLPLHRWLVDTLQ